MDTRDFEFLRISFEVAQQSRDKGNHPFGALLVDENGVVLLEGQNDVVTNNDCTGHAELNLIREMSSKFSKELLATCTIYASTEPCPMCAAAIFWSNVRRVVFGLSSLTLAELVGDETEDVMSIPAQEVLSRGRKKIEVVGPLLEDEARVAHEGFWN